MPCHRLTIDYVAAAAAMQSLTKFYDGQNVAIGGAIVSSTKELDEKMRLYSNINGNLMGPQTAFYMLQAIKVYCHHYENTYTSNVVRHMWGASRTPLRFVFCWQTLGLRFEKQCRTAQRIAEMLEKHPKVCCCCVFALPIS